MRILVKIAPISTRTAPHRTARDGRRLEYPTRSVICATQDFQPQNVLMWLTVWICSSFGYSSSPSGQDALLSTALCDFLYVSSFPRLSYRDLFRSNAVYELFRDATTQALRTQPTISRPTDFDLHDAGPRHVARSTILAARQLTEPASCRRC